MQLSIVESDLSDLEHQEAFVTLLNTYIQDEMGGGDLVEGECKDKILADISAHPLKMILFAKVERAYIGLVVCFGVYSTFRIAPVMNIHDLIVLPEYRQSGVGRKLMLEVEHKARLARCSRISLEVRYDNEKARHLYMTMGYGECNPPMSFWIKSLNYGKVIK